MTSMSLRICLIWPYRLNWLQPAHGAYLNMSKLIGQAVVETRKCVSTWLKYFEPFLCCMDQDNPLIFNYHQEWFTLTVLIRDFSLYDKNFHLANFSTACRSPNLKALKFFIFIQIFYLGNYLLWYLFVIAFNVYLQFSATHLGFCKIEEIVCKNTNVLMFKKVPINWKLAIIGEYFFSKE